MIQPEFANDNEADQPAQEFRKQFKEMMSEFTHTAVLLHGRDLQLENQQRDDDCEDPITESLNSVEAELAPSKATEEAHDFNLPGSASATFHQQKLGR
jgi:hypothetical protein